MMVRPWPLLAALTLLPACNCGQDEPDPTTTGPTATPEPKVPRDKAVLEAVEAVVVVVRPGQWAAVHQALSSWLARLPAQAEPLRQAKTAEDLPRLFAFPLGLGQVDIQGWDPSRPVVASLAETPYDGIPGSVITQLPTLDRKIPPLRHQVLLPATDPSTLVGSLTGLLGPMGKPWPALVEGHAGAHAIDMGDASVALFPADSAVRVVIFQGGVLPDEAERLAYHKEHLTATPQAPVHTPALSLLAQPDGMISALVRPWRLRPLAVLTGSTEMLYALATVGSGNIDSIMARGMHYVLMSELTMTDEGAEVDDLAMSLTADEGTLRVHSVMSLTPKGETIFEAAAKGAGSVQAAANTDAWVDLTMRADARAMLNAAPMPPVFTRGKKLRDGLEAIQNGGFLALGEDRTGQGEDGTGQGEARARTRKSGLADSSR